VGAILVIVADVLGYEPLQMTLVERDDVIQQLAPAASDRPFRNPVLPRAAERGNCLADLVAKLRMTVMQQILVFGVVGKGLT
jgi:hypothetical protein